MLRTNVDVSPSQASLQRADLEPASHGKITFNASAGLHKWSFTESSPLQIDLDAAQLDIQDLVKLAGPAGAGHWNVQRQNKRTRHGAQPHRAGGHIADQGRSL